MTFRLRQMVKITVLGCHLAPRPIHLIPECSRHERPRELAEGRSVAGGEQKPPTGAIEGIH